MVAKLIEEHEIEYDAKWLKPERYAQIAAAVQKLGKERLKPVKEKPKFAQVVGGQEPRCSPS